MLPSCDCFLLYCLFICLSCSYFCFCQAVHFGWFPEVGRVAALVQKQRVQSRRGRRVPEALQL